MKARFILIIFGILTVPLISQERGFDQIFPNLPQEIRLSAFSENGYIRSFERSSAANMIGSSNNNLNPEILGHVLNKSPGFLVEHLLVIPRSRTLLDVYNALGNIRDLKGREYQSHSRGESVLFEDATRIESVQRNNPVSDPAPALAVPRTETLYIRLRDINFGTTFYRADMTLDQSGLRYILTNNRNMTYLFIPVIREEKFTAQLYFEPIQEGILLYSIAGADVSNFISNRIDLPSAIRKRLEVIISWVADGLK